jgi:hypothetical protein
MNQPVHCITMDIRPGFQTISMPISGRTLAGAIYEAALEICEPFPGITSRFLAQQAEPLEQRVGQCTDKIGPEYLSGFGPPWARRAARSGGHRAAPRPSSGAPVTGRRRALQRR